MADVFVSYARVDKVRVATLVAVLEALGWSVWWDPEITPGQEFDDRIDAELAAAKSVLVVWTPASVLSRWVRGEARDAAERGILVPVRFEQARLPIDVRAIHTTDLDDWQGDAASPALQECLHALAAMIAGGPTPQAAGLRMPSLRRSEDARRVAICVLPFANLGGEPEQEYFSDGITEDIITDLGKVSALGVIARNSAFAYKGRNVDIATVAREMKVSHVLEGSVRKAGGRLRINAQLIDGASNKHVWAERYDRDISGTFALQDDISQAIVKALKLRLLPAEKQAIEQRGTDSVEAHDLYLMARQMYVTNLEADERSLRAIIRTCQRATEIDPRYAQAWALIAMAYRGLCELGVQSDDGTFAVERALSLNPALAEAHAIKAYILRMQGAMEAAAGEVEIALELGPASYEANRTAARINYQLQRFEDAAYYFEKAIGLMDSDVNSAMMLCSTYRAMGDTAGMRRAAAMALQRAEVVLARDQNNAIVIAYSANALAALGEGGRAKARMNRALLIDPDNWNMRYNFACALSAYLKDRDAALDMLHGAFETISDAFLPYAKVDPDFELLHDDPRYAAMLAAAEARLAAAKDAAPPENKQPA
ncbi:MAG TPA: TIR domain-containing protein [Rhodanobacteraceae bacterium]